MKRFVVISTVLLSTFAAAGSVSAHLPAWPALHEAPVPAQSFVREARRQISAAEAKRIALRKVSGEVVDIRRIKNTYRVRIIARDGRVVDIVVDANTGRIR